MYQASKKRNIAFSEAVRIARWARWKRKEKSRPLHRYQSDDSIVSDEKGRFNNRGESWVTLLLSDDQAWQSVKLLRSLQNNGTTRKSTLLITENVSEEMETILQREFDHVVLIHSKAYGNHIDSAELLKCHCWNLTEWDKCVFLDSNIVVNKNCDKLFAYEEFSAIGPNQEIESCDTSLFVCSPSTVTYNRLLELATENIYSSSSDDENILWSYVGLYGQPYHKIRERYYYVLKKEEVEGRIETQQQTLTKAPEKSVLVTEK